jgi:hypothetical protein
MMGEMPDIERIGEIIEIGQLVGTWNFLDCFDISTPLKQIYWLTARDTSIAFLPVSITKPHIFRRRPS